MFEKLDAGEIVRTVGRLGRRIAERFPEANLARVAERLEQIAGSAGERVERIRRPNLWLRFGITLLLFSFLLLLGLMIPQLRLSWKIQAVDTLIQTSEALIESLFFIGTAIVFLVTLESRIKRSRMLALVHELRSLAHIVDMHQLTKDPDQLRAPGPRTPSSPERQMTDFELVRYLDYCSEMLALISKIGALYVQGFGDPVVLEAVDEIEDLTNGLSRKIWQKIMIVDQVTARRHELAAPRPRPIGVGTAGSRRRERRARRA